ncbi:hypothetical protein P170DRAFT_105610 [Aspergillus steynii IBT 23096]|uniref:Uncharacterized protein n=1 Tax=Aspergillus steynii IBT 23096 TaxID=1392250 RepID=A0A2I2GHX8_9EURO|nr:uncharacterized protein P170DRAFT_105610 [Aspergillus steynii IBT 23096]PLB52482.1 hypothetical protein P170DRAFT_105610 [Aspergillus steynii IBT 23096]
MWRSPDPPRSPLRKFVRSKESSYRSGSNGRWRRGRISPERRFVFLLLDVVAWPAYPSSLDTFASVCFSRFFFARQTSVLAGGCPIFTEAIRVPIRLQLVWRHKHQNDLIVSSAESHLEGKSTCMLCAVC